MHFRRTYPALEMATAVSATKAKMSKSKGKITKKNKSERDRASDSLTQFMLQIPPETLRFLNENQIHSRHRSGKPVLFCQACSYVSRTVAEAVHHTSQPIHKDSMITSRVTHLLRHLPPITEAHRVALNQVLHQAIEDVVLASEELQRRKEFAASVAAALNARILGLQMHCVGSVLTGLSLADSDVNLDAFIESVNGVAKDCRLSLNVPSADTNILAMQQSESPTALESAHAPVFLDPYKPGFGSLLLEILQIIRSVANNKPPSNSLPSTDTKDGLPPFPPIHRPLQCNMEDFNVTFMDPENVVYRITVGNPFGHHFATLVNLYQSIDIRARQLAILLRKFAKMASLDLPDHHTFLPPALIVLVIFYLQRISPPILPNLQEIAHLHRATLPAQAIEVVTRDSNDLSYLKDLSHLPKFFPAVTASELGVSKVAAEEKTNKSTLADLWLGFLRFYLFEFQLRKCAISITQSKPLSKSNKRYTPTCIWIQDPFSPNESLTRSLLPSSMEYITSQLSAAYAYFGVPRLASSGRHVFTDVQLISRDNVASDDKMASASVSAVPSVGSPESPRTVAKEEQFVKKQKQRPLSNPVSLIGTIDSENDFEPHHEKVISFVVEKFTALSGGSCESSETVSEGPLSISVISSGRVILKDLLPDITALAFEEVCEKESVQVVPSLVQNCLSRIDKPDRCPPQLCRDICLSEATAFTRCFCNLLWQDILKTYLDRGLYTGSDRRLARMWHRSIRSASKSMSRFISATAAQTHVGSADCCQAVGEAPSLENSRESREATDATHLGTSVDAISESSEARKCQNSGLERGDGECHHAKEGPEVPTLSSDGEKAAYDDEPSENSEDCDVEAEEDNFKELGNFDDSNMNEDSFALLEEAAADDLTTDELLFLNEGHSDEELEAFLSDTEHMDASGAVEGSEPNTSYTTSTTLVNGELKASAPTRKKAAKKAAKASQVSETDWSLYIVPNCGFIEVVDSNAPGFYSSEKVSKLTVDDFSFPFIAKGHVLQGKHYLRASVLGLAFPDQPSTLLAHFSAPPQVCKLCGTTGHSSDTCSSTPDTSVSLASWKPLEKNVPPQPSRCHLLELSECLEQLSSYHSISDERFRETFVSNLNALFALQFPTVRLELFGSCANGFGTKNSDMDICVFFPPGTPEAKSLLDVNQRIKIIKSFKRQLAGGGRALGISQMRPVLQAKVPIIKFVVNNKYEADLSFSNYLATKNTRMLRTYNQLDPRLRILNTALKIVIKNCKIAKADSGGISSYAFAILLIHYMQQKDYLPVLQELYEGDDRPIVRAGEWNIWYQDDMELIHKLWKPPSADVLVADMWLGFFRYYLFDFDRERYVVTINQKALLERIAKLWNSLLAIEDPFNLRHNLTSAVQRKVLAHVLNSFYKVLLHHTTFVRSELDPNVWKFSLFSLQEIGPRATSTDKESKREGGRLKSAPLSLSVTNRNPKQIRNNPSSTASATAATLPRKNWDSRQSAPAIKAAQVPHNNFKGQPAAISAYRGRFPHPPPQSGLLGHRPNEVSAKQLFVPAAGHRSFTCNRFPHHPSLQGGGGGPNDQRYFGHYLSTGMNQSTSPAPRANFRGFGPNNPRFQPRQPHLPCTGNIPKPLHDPPGADFSDPAVLLVQNSTRGRGRGIPETRRGNRGSRRPH
ncbi:hypothetical protein AAHC03_025575 [Spirometra sp. Aus1]